jgi:hypothetical protein
MAFQYLKFTRICWILLFCIDKILLFATFLDSGSDYIIEENT